MEGHIHAVCDEAECDDDEHPSRTDEADQVDDGFPESMGLTRVACDSGS